MNYRVAVVEDHEKTRKQMQEMLIRYGESNGNRIAVDCFSDGREFMNGYKAQYDVVFLDIEMPRLNGMDAAKEIRDTDKDVLIVFVTNMAQYAVASYDVRAYDYVLKPISYAVFAMKLDRIMNELGHRPDDFSLTLTSRYATKRVRVADITYVEVRNHDLIFHFSGETFSMRGTMEEIEKKLKDRYFVRCNSCYLVNLEYVTSIAGEYVVVGGEELKISRMRRREFLSEFAMYAGGSK